MSNKRSKADKQKLFIQIMAIILCVLMAGSGVAMVIPYLIAMFWWTKRARQQLKPRKSSIGEARKASPIFPARPFQESFKARDDTSAFFRISSWVDTYA